MGFTVGKVLGGAVERNRIRRRMRAVVRRRLASLSRPVDVVLHPRKAVLDMEFSRLDAEIEQDCRTTCAGSTGYAISY